MTKLTNQEKQAKKPLANANPEDLKEAPKRKVNEEIGLTSDEVAKLNRINDVVEEEIRNIVFNVGSQALVANRLAPIISGPDKLSKLLAYKGDDKRHCNLKLLAAFVYYYGLDFKKVVDKLMNSGS